MKDCETSNVAPEVTERHAEGRGKLRPVAERIFVVVVLLSPTGLCEVRPENQGTLYGIAVEWKKQAQNKQTFTYSISYSIRWLKTIFECPNE